MDAPRAQIDFHKDTRNIFDQTLKSDSNGTISFLTSFGDDFYSATNESRIFATSDDLSTVAAAVRNLDFLPPCATHDDFLLPPSYSEDPLLFSVEHGELQPITSPFMVPGIYRKISTAPADSGRSERATPILGAYNVFISETESCGRIMFAEDFHKLYVCPDEFAELPRRVLLREPMVREEQANEGSEKLYMAKPALSVLENDKLIPKQWDALSKLAYNILKLSNRDHIVIDRKRNEIVRTESGTNQKTIYRFLVPEKIGVKPPQHEKQQQEQSTTASTNHTTHRIDLESAKPKNKIGRPRKRPPDAALEDYNKHPPRKVKSSPQTAIKPENRRTTKVIVNVEPTKQPELRTRSGRIVRIVEPNPIVTPAPAEEEDDPPEASAELMRSFLAELRDSDFRCSQTQTTTAVSAISSAASASLLPIQKDHDPVPLATSSPTETTPPPPKRRVPPESVCPTCKKVFLGRRLQRHYVQNPDHMKVPQPLLASSTFIENQQPQQSPAATDEDMTLFRFLTAKLQRSAAHLSEDQRADLFLAEINDLVKQLQLRSSRLIRNTSGLHFVSARTSRVLGIPEGQYALDISAIERPPPLPETVSMISFDSGTLATAPPPSVLNTQRSLDYTALSMSLDTLTDEAAQKLNLSAGGKLLPPSEESLLRAVDDLVHEGMKKLMHPPPGGITSDGVSNAVVGGGTSRSSSSLVHAHYDHDDNAVEAVSMKDTTNVVAAQQQHHQQQQQQVPPLLDLSVDFFQFNNN